MRKYIILLVALCLHLAARGQTEWEYEYWFDNDRSAAQRNSSSANSWNIEADLSGLSESLHTFHIQILDDLLPSVPVTRYFMKMSDIATATGRYWFDGDIDNIHTVSDVNGALSIDVAFLPEGLHAFHFQVVGSGGSVSTTVNRLFYKTFLSTGVKGRYWFDDDTVNMYTSPQVQGLFDIDVSQLEEGLHTIHYQVIGTDGCVSSTANRTFYKIYISTGMSWRCWFDNDFSTVQQGDGVDDALLLDVSSLADGFHVLHIQADGGSGAASVPMTKPFIKIPQTIGVDDYTCLCMVDDQLFKQEKVPAGQGVVEWNFDVSSLPQGFHRIFVQIVTPSGAASNTWQSFFLRETTISEFAQMKCVYAIDGAEFYTEAGTLGDGTYHFDLDVSSLDDGLHRIAYMLSNGLGVTTKTQCQFFVKTPLGGNGVTEYWYWLNDQADYNAKRVTLSERQDPFSLITLLPVESQPLRSSLFQFRVEQDKPVIYAKNDIHIRFYDASGRFTDVTKQFVDESVKQEVEPVGDLQATQTFNKVAANDIRWYTMQAAPGDTLAFKLSQAGTVQVFAPSGKEVFKTSESESVNWSGIHVWEDGTYYLAVHDVTGSKTDMSLDYFHVGKYAVLTHSPEEVGVVEGNFYIRLYGNGYDKLTNARLVDNSNILMADVIHIQDISNATLQFSFADNNYPRGDFDLELEFTDGNETERVTVVNAVTIADPIFGDIAVDVISRPTVAKPYPVTIKIKNTGNVTYQFVPLYFANSINQLESVQLLNFGLQSSKNIMDAGIKTFYEVDNLFGEDSCIVIPTVIPVLNPYQSIEYQIGFVTGPHAIFNMYAWTETPWSMRSLNIQEVRRYGQRRASTTNITCEMDPCDLVSLIPNSSCVCNVLWGGVSAIANAYGAANQWRNNQLRKAYGQWYEDNGVEWPYADIPLKTPGDIIEQVIRECLGELAPEEISQVQGAIQDALDMMRDRDPQQCPPPPPHTTNPYMPGDPNEIYGYLSEADSKFMTNEIESINYTIEFENDPKIANASAHTITIKDTLDSRYFDLESFVPTSIKLGKQTLILEKDLDVKTVNGLTTFIKTIDVRPAINAIAQIEGKYTQNTGIAEWRFMSLDPMTMEPTDDIMQGILPVNYDGTSGIGEVMFEVHLKQHFPDGTEIPNRAGIIFDYEDVIMTPTWTNIVDATAPESHVSNVQMQNDSTVTVSIEASDELSGPWRYNVYVQYGSGAWFLAAENVPADTTASVKVYEGIDHGFYVVMTDSAGNVEQKEAASEYNFEVFAPQVDTDTKIQLAQGWNWISHNQQKELSVEAIKPKSQRIVSQTDELYKDERIGWIGSLEELSPTELYKVKMTEDDEVQLSGKLFNAEFRSIPLYKGWNWIGYPVANAMTPAEALLKMEAEEGDFIVGQDGMATFTEGQWTGTLLTMEPGMGYMYRSQNDKNLFFNATAQTSSRKANVHKSITNGQWPEDWTVDKRKYPNVMGFVADLFQDDEMVDANKWFVAAFCGNECRGLSQVIGGHLMMNVYGTGGEHITFMALNCENGEVLVIEENEPFRSDILGTMQQPYELHSGMPTGIAKMDDGQWKMDQTVIYDLKGRRVEKSSVANGVYIVTDGNKARKHVNHKRKK